MGSALRTRGSRLRLVEGFAVEFDDVAIGIEDVNLGMARYGIGAELEVAQIVGRQVFAEALLAEPVERFAIAFHAQGEVNVLRIVRPANPLQRAHANNDVEMLFRVPDAEPEAGKIKRWAFDFLELDDVAVETAGALEVVDADQDVMEARFIHEILPRVQLTEHLAFRQQRVLDSSRGH